MRRGFQLVQYHNGKILKQFYATERTFSSRAGYRKGIANLLHDVLEKKVGQREIQSRLNDIYWSTEDSNTTPTPILTIPPQKPFYYRLGFWVGVASVGIGGYLLISLVQQRNKASGPGGILGADFGDNWEEYDKDGRRITFHKGTQATGSQAMPGPAERVNFRSVIGCDEAKEDLADIVEFLKNPRKYEEMSLSMPRGVLLVGPPGCGKTLLARALAGEAGVNVIVTDGASFDQVFVGLGAGRIRKLFQRAREVSPCVIFIDELDALGSRREFFNSTRGTLNQLLVEMDGFHQNKGIVVVAATNLPDKLDRALVRPGRLDRTVTVTLPTKEQRKSLFELYTRKYKDRSEINIDILAAHTPGLSGADIKNVVNIAGVEALKSQKKKVTMKDLINAIEISSMGRENKSIILSPDMRRLTAFHEAGHALTALYTKGSDAVYKATLVPRGPALGVTSFTPKEDEHLTTKESMLARLDSLLGGRAAEELVFGMDKITGGASNDFQKASRLAFHMVAELGMSPRVGPVAFDERSYKNLSSGMKDLIAQEQKALLDASLARVRDLLQRKHKELAVVAEALVEGETLTLSQIQELVKFDEDQKESPANTSTSPFTFVRPSPPDSSYPPPTSTTPVISRSPTATLPVSPSTSVSPI